MRAFRRRGEHLQSKLSSDEVSLLESLIGQLIELLDEDGVESVTEPDAPPADPFALWEQDLAAEPDQPEISEDPVVQRLFPNAYPHDDQASSDFRRFTERDQRRRKLSDAHRVLDALALTDEGRRPLRVGPAEVDAWLKTLTALRLSLAARLGIEDAESAEEMAAVDGSDPRAFVHGIYEWLGFAQESLLRCL